VNSSDRRLRLGARGSALSLAQAGQVARELSRRTGVDVEMVTIRTTGDELSVREAIVGKGIFTKEIDQALLEGRVDLGVHSLKDLPGELPAGLVLASVPVREDPRDVLISHPAVPFARLPRGARIGTSSPRRKAQLLSARPDLAISDARGNVDTRIRRLKEGRWDAIVLARAGLARLGRLSDVTEAFPPDVMIPAVGQGALALVIREDDARTAGIVAAMDDRRTHAEALAERALLRRLEAGCRAPLAGHADVENGMLTAVGAVFSLDGRRALRERISGAATDAERLGVLLAEALLARGAAALVSEARV
jgi:hydroxymethylbilane synthase